MSTYCYYYSFRKTHLIQVDVALSPEIGLDTLRPVTLVKKCPSPPPCEKKTPCLRLCRHFLNGAQYPHINASNIKACYADPVSGEHTCSYIDENVANTLFGDETSNARYIKL